MHLNSDNERRASSDRRNFSYAAHIPERRSGSERRSLGEISSNLENRLAMARQDATINSTIIKVL